jgi:hypothetical protein
MGIEQELTKLYKSCTEVYTVTKGDPSRLKYLRPSQLPFCPPAFFIKHATMGLAQVMDLNGSFYTSVGTTVHEVLQKYLGTSGKFLANWECKICGKKRKCSMKNECCDMPMKYHEVEINHKGVKGHIDAIYRDNEGNYWIVDFKTTSVKSAPRKRTNPGVAYTEQVETYALMLWRQYGIKVKGVVLMFIRRDNPTWEAPVIWYMTLRTSDFKAIEARTERYKKRHQRVLTAQTEEEVLDLAKYGRCNSAYCRVCKSPTSLKKQLARAYKTGSQKNHLPLSRLK